MPRVVAHRGASRRAVENTVAAFRLATEIGADAVELDVRRSADDVLVVHHDPRLADESVIRDVHKVDLPDWMPTLGEALDACAAPGPGWAVNVEIKNDPAEADFDPTDAIAEATIAVLAERDTPERWLISSFRWEVIERCRAIEPQIATAWLCVEVPASAPARLAAAGHRALHPWYRSVTHELVEECHRLGLELNVWTCDSPSAMTRLAGWGVDGICTNVPDIALATLRVR